MLEEDRRPVDVVVGDLDAGAGLSHLVADGVGDGGCPLPDYGMRLLAMHHSGWRGYLGEHHHGRQRTARRRYRHHRHTSQRTVARTNISRSRPTRGQSSPPRRAQRRPNPLLRTCARPRAGCGAALRRRRGSSRGVRGTDRSRMAASRRGAFALHTAGSRRRLHPHRTNYRSGETTYWRGRAHLSFRGSPRRHLKSTRGTRVSSQPVPRSNVDPSVDTTSLCLPYQQFTRSWTGRLLAAVRSAVSSCTASAMMQAAPGVLRT